MFESLEHALKSIASYREQLQQEWLKQNSEAVEDYNRWVEKYGVFSDGSRRW